MLEREADFLKSVPPLKPGMNVVVEEVGSGNKVPECVNECEVVKGDEKEVEECLVAEKEAEQNLGVEECASEVGAEVAMVGNTKDKDVSLGEEGLDLPPLVVDDQRPKFWAETSEDMSLQPWRALADNRQKCFHWKKRCFVLNGTMYSVELSLYLGNNYCPVHFYQLGYKKKRTQKQHDQLVS